MIRKRAEKSDESATSFARWRAHMDITQQEAAKLLGKSRRQIISYERPDPKTHRPATPSHTDRIVMQALADKQALPEPWPE